jgi:hypothetical protein
VVRAVDELLETCTDRQVAARLNELGHRNWKGQAFTLKKVELIRRTYRLKSRFERLRGAACSRDTSSPSSSASAPRPCTNGAGLAC